MGEGPLALPLYPVVLGLVAPLDLFSGNVDRLLLQDVLPSVALSVLIVAVIQTLLSLLLRDRHRGAFAAAVLAAMLFYPRYLLEWGAEVAGWPGLNALLFVAWFTVFTTLFLFALGSRFASGNVSLLGNAFFSAGLFVTLFELSAFLIPNSENPSDDLVGLVAGPLPQSQGEVTGPKRDIYYIVLDRYASADQLREVYDFENVDFVEALEAEGFFFPDPAYANYQRTAHSLASSLNLNYLDDLTAVLGENSGDWRPLYHLLEDTQIHRFLRPQGYRFLHFGSWWNPTRTNRTADENYNWWAAPEFFRVYFGKSFVGFTGQLFGAYAFNTRQQQCDRVERKFAWLDEASRTEGPKFVFAHFLLPHPPFVFGRDGSCLDRRVVAGRSRQENYIAQVEFTNRLILDLVRSLKRNAPVEPIIIIQADEGPWPAPYAGNEIDGLGKDVSPVNWTKATDAELREKMGILHALYLPGSGSSLTYRDMTPVNTFRLVFNQYFGTALPLLPDRNYAYRDNDRLYSFMDVTERLRGQAGTLLGQREFESSTPATEPGQGD